MEQFSVGHRCDFCGQEIVYLPAQIHDPSGRIAQYWYCSDYCAREDLDARIYQREKQMPQHREAERLNLCFFRGLIWTGTTA